MLAAGALLVGCTTTHALGRIDDPGVRAEVDAIGANGDAIVHLRHPPETRPPPFGERVKAVTPPGLVIEPKRGQPLLVAREQVAWVSRYNHARGAGDGAIGGGIAGLVLGVVALGILLTAGGPRCSDNCGDGPDPVIAGLKVGAILGAIGAVLGTGIGAAGGHEDRFEISP